MGTGTLFAVVSGIVLGLPALWLAWWGLAELGRHPHSRPRPQLYRRFG